MSIEEVARRCQASPAAVRLWINLGLLEALETDHGTSVTVPTLLRFLDRYSLPRPVRTDRPVKKILAIDDEPHILGIVREVFEADPRLHLETAESGFEGLIRFGQIKPDLVILDIYMGELNGIDVLRRIKAHPEFVGARVVVLTGFPQGPLLRELAGLDGVDRVLLKPVAVGELMGTVYALLGLSASRSGRSLR